MRKLRQLFGIIMPLLCLMALVACKASLDSSGVYAKPPVAGSLPGAGGGMFLYTVDKTLVDSKDTLNAFVTWEHNNHATVLVTWPSVAQAADSIRANAPQWFADALSLRSAYVAQSSIANSNALNSAVQLIQTAAITSGPLTNNIK